jgi:hypothetical protein
MGIHNKISAFAGLIFTLVPFISAMLNSFIQTPETKGIVIIVFMIAWSLLSYFVISLPYKILRKIHLINSECEDYLGYHLITYNNSNEVLCSVMEFKRSKLNRICNVDFIDFGADFEPIIKIAGENGFHRYSSDDIQFTQNLESLNLKSSFTSETGVQGCVFFAFSFCGETDCKHKVRRINFTCSIENNNASSVLIGNSRKLNEMDLRNAALLTDNQGNIDGKSKRRFKKCMLNDKELRSLVTEAMRESVTHNQKKGKDSYNEPIGFVKDKDGARHDKFDDLEIDSLMELVAKNKNNYTKSVTIKPDSEDENVKPIDELDIEIVNQPL